MNWAMTQQRVPSHGHTHLCMTGAELDNEAARDPDEAIGVEGQAMQDARGSAIEARQEVESRRLRAGG